jgi:hypothetical protein
MKIHSAILKLLHAYRQTDGAILIIAPQCCERAWKWWYTWQISFKQLRKYCFVIVALEMEGI